MLSSCALRKPERKTSLPSLINSGKLEAVLRDHRKKIGFVQSKNCILTISGESHATLRIPKRAVPILPRFRDPTKGDSFDLGEAEDSCETHVGPYRAHEDCESPGLHLGSARFDEVKATCAGAAAREPKQRRILLVDEEERELNRCSGPNRKSLWVCRSAARGNPN